MRTTRNRILLILAAYLVVSASVLVTSGNAELYRLNEAEQLGLQVWRDQNCMTCHSLYGLGGHMGPDLTNASSRYGAHYISQTIRYGRGKMPAYQLSDQEVEALVAYLEKLDQSGEYPLKNFPEYYFGNIVQ